MNQKEYEPLSIEVIIFESDDIVASSPISFPETSNETEFDVG